MTKDQGQMTTDGGQTSASSGEPCPPYLSLVIPAYNEQENIDPLLSRVADAMSQLDQPFEVLMIDDGSTDGTPRLLQEALGKYPWLRILRLSTNSGQTVAFDAGFKA